MKIQKWVKIQNYSWLLFNFVMSHIICHSILLYSDIYYFIDNFITNILLVEMTNKKIN